MEFKADRTPVDAEGHPEPYAFTAALQEMKCTSPVTLTVHRDGLIVSGTRQSLVDQVALSINSSNNITHSLINVLGNIRTMNAGAQLYLSASLLFGDISPALVTSHAINELAHWTEGLCLESVFSSWMSGWKRVLSSAAVRANVREIIAYNPDAVVITDLSRSVSRSVSV